MGYSKTDSDVIIHDTKTAIISVLYTPADSGVIRNKYLIPLFYQILYVV